MVEPPEKGAGGSKSYSLDEAKREAELASVSGITQQVVSGLF
jgi:hypothetical protein